MREVGVVKWFSEDKGYGFIRRADGSDVFVHRTGIRTEDGTLQDGSRVEFDLKQGPRGPQATDVSTLQRIQTPPQPAATVSAVAWKPRTQPSARPGRNVPIGKTAGENPKVEELDLEAALGGGIRKLELEVEDFTIIFDPELTEAEAVAAFMSLANYYRGCGGTGLSARFEHQMAEVAEMVHA